MDHNNSEIFPVDYYSVCSSNSTPRKNRWFCNRTISPSEEQVHLIKDRQATSSTTLQDTTISSSDESPSKNINNLSPLFQEVIPASEDESIIDDTDADPEYNPSSSSSMDGSLSESESLDSVIVPLQNRIQLIKDSALRKCTKYKIGEVSNDTNKQVKSRNADNVSTRKRKRDFCYFCESSVLNFARHLIRNHSSEIEVQKLLSFPVGKKERKDLLTTLRKKGNYLCNSEEGKPMRQGTDTTNYLPCIYCLGFYSTKNLWKHRKQCPQKPNTGDSTASSNADAQNLLIRNLKIDPHLKHEVFPHMRADKVSLIAKKDSLICAFASRYIKIHREKHFIAVASRKMRELSKLLIQAKKLQCSIKNLFDALKPQHYDLLVTATKNVAKYNIEKEYYESPTYAMNIGTSLKQCCDIALMYALKRKEVYATIPAAEAEVELKTLIQLIEAHWKFDVSSQACSDLNTKKWNKITLIPLASDLKLLKTYLIDTANSSIAMLEDDHTNKQAYIKLLETIFCRVLLLNRKRPGELQRFLLHTFETSLENEESQSYEEFSEVVSDAEKALMKNFKRVVIRGKRGRGVPVLFTKDVQDHLKMLLKYRSKILSKSNLYLFGNPNTNQPIIGYKVLKKYAVACGAKNPNAITCTRLRKHLATLTQLFNMSENDMEQLASFMGHTLGVHRSSYRLPDDIYQTAKISKLLLLMEKGNAGQFKGKSLDEIDVDLEENLLENTEEDNIEQRETERLDILDDNDKQFPECQSNLEIPKVLETGNAIKSKKRVLVPWTDEQKKVATSFFKTHIKLKKPPKKNECEKLINLHSELYKNKDWLKVKVFIQNKYTNKLK